MRVIPFSLFVDHGDVFKVPPLLVIYVGRDRCIATGYKQDGVSHYTHRHSREEVIDTGSSLTKFNSKV